MAIPHRGGLACNRECHCATEALPRVSSIVQLLLHRIGRECPSELLDAQLKLAIAPFSFKLVANELGMIRFSLGR